MQLANLNNVQLAYTTFSDISPITKQKKETQKQQIPPGDLKITTYQNEMRKSPDCLKKKDIWKQMDCFKKKDIWKQMQV